MTIAAFVLSLVGLVLSLFGGWFSIIAFPVSLVGLILAAKQMKENKSGLATAGLVIGIIATVISAIFFFTCGLCALIAVSSAA